MSRSVEREAAPVRAVRAGREPLPSERMRLAGRLLAALALATALCAPLSAQNADGIASAPWLRAWQPLRALTLSADPLLGPAARGRSLLVAPAPRRGLFWTAGNPAGLPAEAGNAWTRFAASRDVEDGDYRRSMDPVRRVGDRVEGTSFGGVGDWGAAAGEVAFDHVRLDPHSFADVIDPYRGTPFVLTDTSHTDFRRLGVRLEGAIGVRLGRWAIGVGGGHRSVDNRTRESGFPRFGRLAVYGATVGAARELGENLRIGVHGRYRGEAESMQLAALEEGGRVYELEGWREPSPIEFSPPSSLFRRSERDGFAVGAQLAGSLLGADWVLWGERGKEDETQINRQQAEEGDPFNRWDTTSWRVDVSVLRPLGPFEIEADASWTDWSGEATQPDFEEVVYLDSGSRFGLSGGARWTNADGTWLARLGGGAIYGQRERRDRLVNLRSDLQWWTIQASADVARRFGDWGIEAGYGLGVRDPRGSTPSDDEFEEIAGILAGESLAVDATPLTTHRVGATITWDVSGRTTIWLGGEYLRLSSGDRDPGLGFGLLDGTRTAWRSGFGVILRGG